MPLSVRQVGRWIASSICRGVASSEVELACHPRVGPLPSSKAEFACLPRVGPLPSSEAEMWCAVEGLGGEASSEAEIAPWVRGGPRMGRTMELGREPIMCWASWEPGEDLGIVGGLWMLHCIRV